jgi:hypothetical protein
LFAFRTKNARNPELVMNRRAISVALIAVTSLVLGACVAPTAPRNDDDPNWDPYSGTCRSGWTVGTSGRCEPVDNG